MIIFDVKKLVATIICYLAVLDTEMLKKGGWALLIVLNQIDHKAKRKC